MIDSSYVLPVGNIGNIGMDTANYALFSLITQQHQAYSAMHNPFWMTGHYRPQSESYSLYEEAVRRGNGNVLGSVEIVNHETEDSYLVNAPADGVSFRHDMGVKTLTYEQYIQLGDFARRKNFQINDELDQFRGLLNPIIASKIFANMKTISTDLAPKSTFYVARKFESAMHYVYRLRDEANKVLVPFLQQYDIPGEPQDYTTKPSYRTANFLINNTKRLIAGESLNYSYEAVSTVADEGFFNLCSQYLQNFTDGRNTQIVGTMGAYETVQYSGKFGVAQSPYKLQDRMRYFKKGSAAGTGDGYVVPRYSSDGKTLLSGLGGDKNWRLFWLEPVSYSPDKPTCAPGSDWYAYIAADSIVADKSMIAVGDIFEFVDLTKFAYRPSTAPTSVPLQLIASDLSVDKYVEDVVDTHFIKAKDWGRGLGVCFRIRLTNPFRLPVIYQHPSGDINKRVIADGEGKGNLWLSGLTIDPAILPDVTLEGNYVVIKGDANGGAWAYDTPNSDIFEQTTRSPRKVSAIQLMIMKELDPSKGTSVPLYVMANNRSMIYSFRGDSVNHIPFLYDHLNPDASFNDVMMGRGRLSYERELVNFKDYQPLSLRMGWAPSTDWKYHMIKCIAGVSTLAYRNNTNFIGAAINPEGLGMSQEGYLGQTPVTGDSGGDTGGGTLRSKRMGATA